MDPLGEGQIGKQLARARSDAQKGQGKNKATTDGAQASKLQKVDRRAAGPIGQGICHPPLKTTIYRLKNKITNFKRARARRSLAGGSSAVLRTRDMNRRSLQGRRLEEKSCVGGEQKRKERANNLKDQE